MFNQGKVQNREKSYGIWVVVLGPGYYHLLEVRKNDFIKTNKFIKQNNKFMLNSAFVDKNI